MKKARLNFCLFLISFGIAANAAEELTAQNHQIPLR